MSHLSDTQDTDVIIVGGGVMGLAAAYYAAQQGLRVQLLEQHDNDDSHLNSSYGESRMYRLMYSNPYLAELSAQGLALWQELEATTPETLLSNCGLLFYGVWGEEETIEGSLDGAEQVMQQRNIPFQHLDSAGLNNRFPVFQNMPEKFEGLYEGGSGFVYSDRACQAFRQGAKQQGVVFHTSVCVTQVNADDTGVMVLSDTGEIFTARKAILCPGAWANDLLKRSFDLQLNMPLWHMDWAHYRVDSALEKEYPEWFCFSPLPEGEDDPSDDGLYYGFPSLQDGQCRIKVGVDWTERTCTSMRDFCYTPSETMLAKLDRFVRTQFRGIGERLDVSCSPYAMSDDVHFVLDHIPDHSNVVLFTAGSGQAFKFAPLIGKLLVELVSTGKTETNIQPFNIDRLRVVANDNDSR